MSSTQRVLSLLALTLTLPFGCSGTDAEAGGRVHETAGSSATADFAAASTTPAGDATPQTRKARATSSVEIPGAGEDPAIQAIDAYIEEQQKAGAIDRSREGWRRRLPKFPEVELPEGSTYFWRLETNVGDMEIRFFPEVAPNHVANFLYLTRLGYFDGIVFHRVIPGFMAQGGDPTGTGGGGPGYTLCGETDPDVKHDRAGLLSMAKRSAPCTAGSQFFLTFVETPWLDGKHTIFGEIVEGMDTLKELEKRGSRTGRTTEPLVMEKVSIEVR